MTSFIIKFTEPQWALRFHYFFADICMHDLEKSCLNTLKLTHNCNVLFYFRYVDDTILCAHKNFVNTLNKVFISYHKKLQFTYKLETGGKINFLDSSLIRINNRLITDWYQKLTSSGRLLNFYPITLLIKNATLFSISLVELSHFLIKTFTKKS